MLQPEVLQERIKRRLAAEEGAHEDVAIDRAARLEDTTTVCRAEFLVQRAGLLEARKHIVREDLRPLVAVVARVIAEEVAEAGLPIRVLRRGEAHNRVQVSGDSRRVLALARAVEGHIELG